MLQNLYKRISRYHRLDEDVRHLLLSTEKGHKHHNHPTPLQRPLKTPLTPSQTPRGARQAPALAARLYHTHNDSPLTQPLLAC